LSSRFKFNHFALFVIKLLRLRLDNFQVQIQNDRVDHHVDQFAQDLNIAVLFKQQVVEALNEAEEQQEEVEVNLALAAIEVRGVAPGSTEEVQERGFEADNREGEEEEGDVHPQRDVHGSAEAELERVVLSPVRVIRLSFLIDDFVPGRVDLVPQEVLVPRQLIVVVIVLLIRDQKDVRVVWIPALPTADKTLATGHFYLIINQKW
jgi:hypothetical protein